MGMGTMAHLHSHHCHTCACIPTQPPPFTLSHPELVPSCLASFPSHYQISHWRGILVTPCGVVDVPFDIVMVKGSGWCKEGRTIMWQYPHLAVCGTFRAWQSPKSKKMQCFGLIRPISVSISMIQISIWRAFYVYFECVVYVSGFLCFHSLFFVAFVKLTWLFDFWYQKRE